MKRIRCPKCDHPILLDDKLYFPGRILIFSCFSCKKNFKIKVPERTLIKKLSHKDFGSIVILENEFQFKQSIKLKLGNNIIGRFVKGTKANATFKTMDPSIDTRHCIINVKENKIGKFIVTLRDAPSNTGTFVENKLLASKEIVKIENGTIFSIGAATLIYHLI